MYLNFFIQFLFLFLWTPHISLRCLLILCCSLQTMNLFGCLLLSSWLSFSFLILIAFDIFILRYTVIVFKVEVFFAVFAEELLVIHPTCKCSIAHFLLFATRFTFYYFSHENSMSDRINISYLLPHRSRNIFSCCIIYKLCNPSSNSVFGYSHCFPMCTCWCRFNWRVCDFSCW